MADAERRVKELREQLIPVCIFIAAGVGIIAYVVISTLCPRSGRPSSCGRLPPRPHAA